MKGFVGSLLSICLLVVMTGCSAFGVSRGYNYSKQQIWEAINTTLSKNYGGVKRIEQEPPTAVSNLSVKDKKFGIDKSAYQVFAGVSGFNRPYVVDVEVRVYPNGDEKESYSKDKGKAEEIQDELTKYLNDKRYNSSMQDLYVPY
jgi:hypothetical protein